MIRLPVPPSANHYWRDRAYQPRNGKAIVQRYRTKAARQFVEDVQALVRGAGYLPIQRPHAVVVRIKWYREARRGDLDNRLKVLLDSLQGVLYENDAQIVGIHAERFEDKADPRVEVMVEVSA